MVREVCRYFVFTEQFEKGMQLLKHSIDCTLLPNYKTQPFRLLLWKYSEAATFFAIYSISSMDSKRGNVEIYGNGIENEIDIDIDIEIRSFFILCCFSSSKFFRNHPLVSFD